MKSITSTDNPIFKKYLKLLKSSGIKKEGLAIACGDKIVADICIHHSNSIDAILSTQKIGFPHLIKNKHIELSSELFKELDIFETHKPLAVIQVPFISKWEAHKPQGLELLVPVQDPSNLGAIVRSAYAFGVKKIILLKESTHPFHPKSIRASSSYVMDMQFEEGPSIQDLKIEDVIALDMKGTSLKDFKWPQNCYLLVGEEGMGVPQSLKAQHVSIEMNTDCESLNVVVATSIALHSKFRL